MKIHMWLVCIVVLSLTACMPSSQQRHQQKVSQNTQYDQSVEDLMPAKEYEIVELNDGDTFDITAHIVSKNINGKDIKMLAYNGSIPGPMIKAPRGSEVTIRFTNKTDEEALLHSHGIRLDNKYDGTHLTQDPIKIGESFEYVIRFPDEGMYWYHPHIREDYTQESGLYGNYFVTSEETVLPYNEGAQEVPLFLDDILLDSSGNLVPFRKDGATHTLMGRYGNHMLVNGETHFEIDALEAKVTRLYITNVANVRPFRLTLSQGFMKLVGGDAGFYEREQQIDSVIVSPSERVIVDVYFPDEGTFQLFNENPQSKTPLVTFHVSGEHNFVSDRELFETENEHKNVIASIDPYRAYFDKPVDKNIRLSVDLSGHMNMSQMPCHKMGNVWMGQCDDHPEAQKEQNHHHDDHENGIEWEDHMPMMNQMSNTDNVTWKIIDEDSQQENMDIDWDFQQGDIVKIRIFNDPDSDHPMQHPIHFHGQRFLVLSTDGVANTNMVWKDTVLVEQGDTVDILLEVTNPGDWMFHCHIAEHLEADMMGQFSVD